MLNLQRLTTYILVLAMFTAVGFHLGSKSSPELLQPNVIIF